MYVYMYMYYVSAKIMSAFVFMNNILQCYYVEKLWYIFCGVI